MTEQFVSSKWGTFEVNPNQRMLKLPKGTEVEIELLEDVIRVDLYAYITKQPNKLLEWLEKNRKNKVKKTVNGKKQNQRKTPREKVGHASRGLNGDESTETIVFDTVAEAIYQYLSVVNQEQMEQKRASEIQPYLGTFK